MAKPGAAKAARAKRAAAKAKAASKLSHRDLRCAVIIALIVATPLATAQAIAKAQGAGGNDYIKRLVQHLQTYNSLDDGPRNTQPRIYTDEVFEAALDVLGCHKQITEAKLVKELQKLDILPPGKRDVKYFFSLLKAWCSERGLEAKAGVTRGESFLNKDDFGARLEFVIRLNKLMEKKGYSFSDLVFMDETSVNASNHPKCKCRVPACRRRASHGISLGVAWQPMHEHPCY
jgi:hypothetical protein